jgi:hypothetical protein
MLNQSNYNFNKVLTYLDQGGNNIWWSSNSTIKTISSAELIINGQGIDSECIEEDCIPICSEIVESEEAVIEQLTRPQYLIYPTFIIESNTLTIELNNLQLINQPNSIEDNCIDSSCTEEYGIWTKAIKTRIKTVIEDETYYFIKANVDNYKFGYIYTISLIHEATGEEIVTIKDKGLLNSIIIEDISVPNEFNVCISITKFNIEEVITTYRFINNPLYLRSNWLVNTPWQPTYNNVEEVLLSIIYLLNTNLEIEVINQLVLYKDNPQQILIETLLKSITSITSDNSNIYSYIKNVTTPSEYNKLATTNTLLSIEDISINPAVYSTTPYIKYESNNTIIFLLLICISISNNTSLQQTYIDLCIDLETNTLKEDVLKLISFIEAYKQTKDIYHLSIATSTLNQINKRYKLEDNSYIESLNNPISTVESKVYGDLLDYYVYNNPSPIVDYTLEQITYITDINNNLYLLNSPTNITNDPLYLLILKLIGINLNTNLLSNNKLITDVLNIQNTTYLTSKVLTNIDLISEEILLTYKNTIPCNFEWLSDTTPIQDLIISCIIKPLIDLQLHINYQKEEPIIKEALTRDYISSFISNKKELLLDTFELNNSQIRNSLWPGKYSNSIDLEINGYYTDEILNEVNNIKSLGIKTNLISSINLPTESNFNVCIDIIQFEDSRCQVNNKDQLVLLPDGQCDLSLPDSILLQEDSYPITQESSTTDYIFI